MKPARPMIVILALLALALLGWWLLGDRDRDPVLTGYIEGESLYLAAPVAGTVGSIAAVEGQRVAAGAPLFTIEPATLSAQDEQARARVAEAGTQIAAAEAAAQQALAEVTAAAAAADRARRDLDRLIGVRRADAGAVAGQEIDAARAALREANARLSAARNSAEARRAQIRSARAHTDQARSGVREVQIRVGQLSPAAPAAGRVERIFFQPGEWVSANQPVLSLLPDGKVKVRFYVPQGEISRYRPGRSVRFSCDGCAAGLIARIAYVSPTPEFTPPVIFSRESRDRLVFLVEALPAQPTRLAPGLPVDVEPLK